MKNKWKSKIVIALLGIAILSAWGIPWDTFGNSVPRQACACIPPEYAAHFTEEEAINIIRTQLEAVGLNFDSEVPSYYVEAWDGGDRWGMNVGIDLFDEERNVAITFVNMFEDTTSSITEYAWWERGRSTHIETEFSENYQGIVFGVFSWKIK